MKMTSAQVAKLLRQLNDKLNALQSHEAIADTFIASINEDIEAVRPEYDYKSMQNQQIEVETKIRKLKHRLNVFNSTTIIPEFNMTIDEMLIYLPQLTKRWKKLSNMKNVLPKSRIPDYSGSNIIDYKYTNYDIKIINEDYINVSNELSKAQTALDYINNTMELEIDL